MAWPSAMQRHNYRMLHIGNTRACKFSLFLHYELFSSTSQQWTPIYISWLYGLPCSQNLLKSCFTRTKTLTKIMVQELWGAAILGPEVFHPPARRAAGICLHLLCSCTSSGGRQLVVATILECATHAVTCNVMKKQRWFGLCKRFGKQFKEKDDSLEMGNEIFSKHPVNTLIKMQTICFNKVVANGLFAVTQDQRQDPYPRKRHDPYVTTHFQMLSSTTEYLPWLAKECMVQTAQ